MNDTSIFNLLESIMQITEIRIEASQALDLISMYKSLKYEIALTLKLLLLWLSNCRKLLILGCSFMWCNLFIFFMFVYEKNKDTPFCIGSMCCLQMLTRLSYKWKWIWLYRCMHIKITIVYIWIKVELEDLDWHS